MFAGKTGDRLIARYPVAEGSFADVSLRTEVGDTALVRLVDRGGYSSTYPALTPVFDTLDTISTSIRRFVESELIVGSGVLKAAGITLDDILADRDEGTVLRRLLDGLDPELQDASEPRLYAFVNTPPVCPRIMAGQPVQLILGSAISRQHSIPLGIVEGIDIFNQQTAEV